MDNHERGGSFEIFRKQFRAWLRAIHRDVGYLVIGLTFIYALSGIAINHLGSWDPNFKSVVNISQLEGPFPKDEAALVTMLVAKLKLSRDDVQAAFYDGDTIFELALVNGSARLDTTTGVIRTNSRESRFFLRVANWLHYNRGKATWTYIADGYAVLLLYLAVSGAFIIKGRKGILGRGAILILIGAAIPFLYVQFTSGP
ncbi:PepSY-associated TM helix domain-containing protein [bacterium]|nr:PepSY-associated TM helix domain-containing protein [bacterium]